MESSMSWGIPPAYPSENRVHQENRQAQIAEKHPRLPGIPSNQVELRAPPQVYELANEFDGFLLLQAPILN